MIIDDHRWSLQIYIIVYGFRHSTYKATILYRFNKPVLMRGVLDRCQCSLQATRFKGQILLWMVWKRSHSQILLRDGDFCEHFAMGHWFQSKLGDHITALPLLSLSLLHSWAHSCTMPLCCIQKRSEKVWKSAQEVFGLGLRWSHLGLSRVSTAPGEPCLLCRPGATGRLGRKGRHGFVNWTVLRCWSQMISLWFEKSHSLYLALVSKGNPVLSLQKWKWMEMDCAASWNVEQGDENGIQKRGS